MRYLLAVLLLAFSFNANASTQCYAVNSSGSSSGFQVIGSFNAECFTGSLDDFTSASSYEGGGWELIADPWADGPNDTPVLSSFSGGFNVKAELAGVDLIMGLEGGGIYALFDITGLQGSYRTTRDALTDFRIYRQSAVPVPAAVWLFGSGLGLLGWMRRK